MTESQPAAGRRRPGLTAILAATRRRVAGLQSRRAALERAAARAPRAPEWTAAFQGPDLAVIAEIKRRSPSAGVIAPDLDPAAWARAYQAGGARALSVLTDAPHFGGSLEDLTRVREVVELPVLRKDFLIDPVQLFEARAAGASAVLLIVRALGDAVLDELARLAADLGLARLVEVHTADELARAVRIRPECIGVNSRDLETFVVDVAATAPLLAAVPPDLIAVAESGIAARADVTRVAAWGADAILVGTALSGAFDPAEGVRQLTGVPRSGRESKE